VVFTNAPADLISKQKRKGYRWQNALAYSGKPSLTTVVKAGRLKTPSLKIFEQKCFSYLEKNKNFVDFS
jgi:hypothetical protein